MKKNYLFLLCSLIVINLFAQQDCSDAQSDLNYAYSHVKSAYESNNLTHLKYYSKRSFDAFERAKESLNSCGCSSAYENAYEAHKNLFKVQDSKSFEDGRFNVKRAKELAKKSIDELELCSKYTKEDEVLAELEFEQLKLKEQQEKLRQKEAEIKKMLLLKEQKELRLKKEKLIAANEEALSANIKAFNEMLLACGCNSKIKANEFTNDNLLLKNIVEIKEFYLTSVKKITSLYLENLNNCKM